MLFLCYSVEPLTPPSARRCVGPNTHSDHRSTSGGTSNASGETRYSLNSDLSVVNRESDEREDFMGREVNDQNHRAAGRNAAVSDDGRLAT